MALDHTALDYSNIGLTIHGHNKPPLIISEGINCNELIFACKNDLTLLDICLLNSETLLIQPPLGPKSMA